MQPEPQTWAHLVDAARERGEQATKRAAEVRERIQQLEEGRLAAAMAVEADLWGGELTAERAAKRAAESRERATAAYLDAATAHDLAARAYELATKTDPTRAEEYRRHAQRHRCEAEAARHRARLEMLS